MLNLLVGLAKAGATADSPEYVDVVTYSGFIRFAPNKKLKRSGLIGWSRDYDMCAVWLTPKGFEYVQERTK